MDNEVRFSKWSGSGNDFLCMDNRDGRFDEILVSQERLAHFTRTLCRRGLGVGADGIVFAVEPEIEGVADIAAKFLEMDGTESTLCGNGTACFVRWAVGQGIVSDGEVSVLTAAGVVLGQNLDDGYTRVCIPLPEEKQTHMNIQVDGELVECDYIVTGCEHLVVYVDDADTAPVGRLGPLLRHHECFPQPRGVNVNFVQVLGEGELAIRTYEYGVEAETLACGTGSASAAILAAGRFDWGAEYTSNDRPVRLRTRSGDVLRVYVGIDENDTVTDLCLETLVRCSYSATLCPDLAKLALRPVD
ncbi:MAG: diaminopimelate epimerase [Phycisphaerae bacterium]|jgi:diaminopimelate epimerase|nr:diaminopimelate epimerase [Phycisphaerae bacterium]